MRLVWTSDIHLNHANLRAWDVWMNQVKQADADALLITGDISESDDLDFQLRRITESLPIKIFFVLGNHDFYGSSIASTRRNVSSIARDIPSLCYLTDTAPIELAPNRFLVGEDGWGDGVEGDFENSPVRLSDFGAIKDFCRVDPADWLRLMREQGSESADRLRSKLATLPESTLKVTVATHVPPFRESCWYEGETTDDNWAPFFVCAQVGDVLRQFAASHPRTQTTVMCGHTHHGGTADISPNLTVLTAPADYGAPRVERVFEL